MLIYIEIIQFKDLGPRKYFKSRYNINDCLQTVVFIIYFIFRLTDQHPVRPESSGFDRRVGAQTILSLLNVILVINMTVKILYLIRFYQSLG